MERNYKGKDKRKKESKNKIKVQTCYLYFHQGLKHTLFIFDFLGYFLLDIQTLLLFFCIFSFLTTFLTTKPNINAFYM